jgi:type IV secretory pathway TrbL component
LLRSFERAAARAQNLLRRASFEPGQNENSVAQPNGAPLGLTAQKQFQEKISAGSRAAASSQGETGNGGAKVQGASKACKRTNLYAGSNPQAVYRA